MNGVELMNMIIGIILFSFSQGSGNLNYIQKLSIAYSLSLLLNQPISVNSFGSGLAGVPRSPCRVPFPSTSLGQHNWQMEV